MIKKPDWIKDNYRFVWSYHGELRIYFETTDNIYNDERRKEIKKFKNDLLEQALGYKIQNLEEIVPHDEWEKTHA